NNVEIADDIGGHGGRGHGGQRPDGGNADNREDCEPDGARGYSDRPGGGEQDTQGGRDSLPAVETEPDREEMAKHRKETGEQSRRVPRDRSDNEERGGAFAAIQDQGGRGKRLAAGAENVGGT